MGEPLRRRTETFIVRVWVEYLEQTPPIWRGEIEHVGEEGVIRFGSLDEMTMCIESMTTVEEDDK